MNATSHRRLCCLVVALVCCTREPAAGQDVRQGDLRMRLKTIAAWDPEVNILSDQLELTPTDVVALPGERLLVATLGGTIRMVDRNDVLLDQPVLTTSQVGLQLQEESGMTGLAVHPNFAGDANRFGYGKLYTITTEHSAGNGGLSEEAVDFPFADAVHQDVIREWDLRSLVKDAGTQALPSLSVDDSREVLRVGQPGPYHDLFDITFDYSLSESHPDYGQLYISSGDGGDSKSNSSTSFSRKLAGQDLGSIYGNILRIHPDPTAHGLVRISQHTGLPAYSIAPTNPFNGDEAQEGRGATTLAEIYAYGFRSPYRMNFDSFAGTLLVSEVGESKMEEVSSVTIGGNYGWGAFEGTLLHHPDIELQGPSEHLGPVFEYGRDEGRAVIGGTVYRGSMFPELVGKYVFADFGQSLPSARLFYGSANPSDPDYGVIYEFDASLSESRYPISTDKDDVADASGALPDRIFSLGEDENHELIILAGQDPRTSVNSVAGAYIIRLTRGLGCDINGDGRCEVGDLDQLVRHLGLGQTDAVLDVDWNDSVDIEDVTAWLTQAGQENGTVYWPGDTDLNGNVDLADFLLLSQHFGQPATGWGEGNFDGRGGTNFADFLMLSANFGGRNGGMDRVTSSIPEPETNLLVMLGSALASAAMRRKHGCLRASQFKCLAQP